MQARRRAVPSVVRVVGCESVFDPKVTALADLVGLRERSIMKSVALFLICAALAGCLSYRPDQRVVGRFRAATGELLEIRSDGRIGFVAKGEEELVGLVTVDREEPLSIRVIAPDISPLVGTDIVFSADGTRISVAWADWRNPAPRDRPTEFRRE